MAKRFKYRREEWPAWANAEEMLSLMDGTGDLGWELVQIMPMERDKHGDRIVVVWFKREIA
jgi:hypothetical protein